MSKRWDDVSRVFAEVVALPVDEQESALERLCANDAELETEVRSLLAHHRTLAPRP